MSHEGGYPPWFVEGLIFGEYACPEWCSCGQQHDAEEWSWSRLRARLEATGVLEGATVSLVLDLERALLELHKRHPLAASAVLTQVFFEPANGPKDLSEVFGNRANVPRQVTKAIAWLSGYLTGLPISAPKGQASCESRWRSAR